MELTLAYWIRFAFVITLDTTNCILHGVGAYLLYCYYRKNQECTQNICILNLACIELSYSFVDIISHMLHFIHYFGVRIKYYNAFMLFCCAIIFLQFGLIVLYYAAMIFLTGDRLFSTLFPFKYRQYFHNGKAKKIILATWILIGIFVITLTAFSSQYGYLHFFYTFYPYQLICILAMDCIFLIFAVSTYIVMFCSYVKSRRIATQLRDEPILKTFMKSRFYISALIMGSFLLLCALAHIFQISYYFYRDGLVTLESLMIYTDISISLSFTSDGIIYIYLQKSVRKMFFKKFSLRQVTRTGNELEMRQLQPQTDQLV